MMLTVAQRRIGLGCAVLLAIAMTVVGDDKSIQLETPKPLAPGPGGRGSAAAPDKPVRIEVAKLFRVPPTADGVDVFAPKSRNKPPVVREAIGPLPQPVAPPLPFQYVGQIEGKDGPTVLLSRGAESFSVRAGEPIDPNYLLEMVTAQALTIVYLPLNERQTLSPEPK
jgi:hypothetical protein